MQVLLLDAERSLHRGLEMRLQREPDITRVVIADTLNGALHIVELDRPDVVVVDPAGLGTDPELAIADLRGSSPDCKIIVLSLRDDAESREQVLAAGAYGFVSKHDGSERLIEVLRSITRFEASALIVED